jgi:hypothetical protein
MRTFTASMSYELGADTSAEARKLLLAELAGRRWRDRLKERHLPSQTLVLSRSLDDDQTTNDLHDMCASDLRDAARSVQRMGRAIQVLRAFIQVSGAGTHGLAPVGFFDEVERAP